jgi:hypothetical protein
MEKKEDDKINSVGDDKHKVCSWPCKSKFKGQYNENERVLNS